MNGCGRCFPSHSRPSRFRPLRRHPLRLKLVRKVVQSENHRMDRICRMELAGTFTLRPVCAETSLGCSLGDPSFAICCFSFPCAARLIGRTLLSLLLVCNPTPDRRPTGTAGPGGELV
jgi:hypothetical protein